MGQRIVGQQKSRLVLCPLPFYWCHLLMAQTVERTAYAQNAEGTLRVGTVEGEFHIPWLVTGQCSGVHHQRFKPRGPQQIQILKPLQDVGPLVQQRSVEFDLAGASTTKSSFNSLSKTVPTHAPVRSDGRSSHRLVQH
jgi:hypothetical protein